MPPPAAAPSNIRSFVRWREGSVYSGEEIECIITFKNVAAPPGQEADAPNGHPRDARQVSAPAMPHSRRSSKASHSRVVSAASTTKSGPVAGRGHRPALSLNVGGPSRGGGLNSAPLPAKAPNSAVSPATKGHGRSLSIMSWGSDAASEGRGPIASPTVKRPARPHGRSASLQVLPKASPQVIPNVAGISPRQPSPLFESTTPPALTDGQNDPLPIRSSRRRPDTQSAGTTPQLSRQSSLRRNAASQTFNAGFQFPPPQQGAGRSPPPQTERPRRSPSNMHSGQHRSTSPRPPEGWSGALSNLNPITRVMSESSTTGTPRTSSEFYSISNHSDETLTSEIASQGQHNGKILPKPSHSRQASNARQVPKKRPAEPETLMMGYAQTTGYFTLDGSLVNAAPFEEVKRKGVQGGGGVVGIEKSKRGSGMFGAFKWGNIGESLGGFLGSEEMSSMAQMKASAGSRSIPLLSTPQNLLFVDLRLAPGESRSYNYRFVLPRGLPPTHRGRAIKVFYQLVLGVQRPDGQAVKRVDIPFRILGSYNARGDALGHDLMSPYILLQDAAKSSGITVDPSTASEFPKFAPKVASKQSQTPKRGLEDFLRYTERLIEEPQDSHGALMSPTSPSSPVASRKQSLADQPPSSVKDAVDFAILRANHQQTEGQSANRFNIARAGHPVAVLTILRPAYRLGESVVGTIDFTAPSAVDSTQSPTYSVVTELESTERVDPSLALRSSNSITRVTRKTHASARDNAIFARQTTFSLAIPATATPTFETTGVSLAWRLRVEFTTERHAPQDEQPQLLEEIGSDERGRTLIAKERLLADTFEIEVPLKVFGVPGIEAVGVEGEALEI